MNRLNSPFFRGTIAALAVVLLGSAGAAHAQSVRGSGINHYYHGVADGGNYFYKVEVNAWVDSDGVAQGTISYQGGLLLTLPHPWRVLGGPANPYILAVTNIRIEGNTAYVDAVTIASPDAPDGLVLLFTFTDNTGTSQPDEIGGEPIQAGRITISTEN